METLQRDGATREGWPTTGEIETETVELRASLPGGRLPEDALERLAIILDLMVRAGAAEFDKTSREAKLAELKKGLIRGETHLVEHEIGECPAFCVFVIWSMLPERSKDDDDFERVAGRAAEGLQAA